MTRAATHPADGGSLPGHVRATLVLGLPLVGSHLAQFATKITDTVMLGWYGVEPLAAAVLGSTMFFLLFLLGAGFSQAVMPLVASASAGEAVALARRVTRMGMWLSLLFAAAVMPLMWWSEAVFLALGQDPAVSALAQDYLRIAGWGLGPALLVMVLKSFLAALERTSWVLWVTVAAAVLNALINYAFIFGNWGAPELGVRGAAIASLGTQTATILVLGGYVILARDFRPYTLFARFWRADWGAFAQVFRLGWPIGLTLLAEVGLFSATSIMVGWIGTRELAAHGIAIEITAAFFMIHLGLANAATVRIGRARGAADGAGLRQAARAGGLLTLVVAGASMTVFVAFPEFLVGLFLDPSDPARPAIVAIGAALLLVAAIFQLADGAQVMALGLLRGIQDTRVPMLMAAFAYWGVGAPASYFFGFILGFGVTGVWWGLIAGLAAAGILMTWRFLRLLPSAMTKPA